MKMSSDLTCAMFEQMQSYIDHRDSPDSYGGWYYGNREQFEKRHVAIKAWLAREVHKAPRSLKPETGFSRAAKVAANEIYVFMYPHAPREEQYLPEHAAIIQAQMDAALAPLQQEVEQLRETILRLTQRKNDDDE